MLSKIERGHAQDLDDVRLMLETGLVDRDERHQHVARIEPELYRYPALDPPSFRARLEASLGR